jgi:hypothetical protein
VTAVPALVAGLAFGGPPAAPGDLSLGAYQREDGAITVAAGGDLVDPYFAARALLAAEALGADARRPARAFIRWLLPFQEDDGRFPRLCRRGARFEPCARADADDALLALWMELLVRFAPAGELPTRWGDSLRRADAHLRGLLDEESGVHVLSQELPVGLLMDNVEVHAALRAIAGHHERRGEETAARAWRARADALAAGIDRTFRAGDGFRVSTQRPRTAPGAGAPFYPDRVAQAFPLLADLPAPGGSRAAHWARWIAATRGAWLDPAQADYAWGLVAVVAARMGDRDAVRAWAEHAAPFRGGSRWNVVEEAVLVAIAAREDA